MLQISWFRLLSHSCVTVRKQSYWITSCLSLHWSFFLLWWRKIQILSIKESATAKYTWRNDQRLWMPPGPKGFWACAGFAPADIHPWCLCRSFHTFLSFFFSCIFLEIHTRMSKFMYAAQAPLTMHHKFCFWLNVIYGHNHLTRKVFFVTVKLTFWHFGYKTPSTHHCILFVTFACVCVCVFIISVWILENLISL